MNKIKLLIYTLWALFVGQRPTINWASAFSLKVHFRLRQSASSGIDRYFKESLGIKAVPSESTLRQRMDDLASQYRAIATYQPKVATDSGKIMILGLQNIRKTVTVAPLDRF